MMIETLTNETGFVIRAEGELTSRTSGEFKNHLTEALERYQEIVVDLRQVETIDLACLQLLYCAKQIAHDAKRNQLFKVIFSEGFLKGLALQAPSDI